MGRGILLCAVALLAACAVAFAGPIPVHKTVKHAACCVRTFLRNTKIDGRMDQTPTQEYPGDTFGIVEDAAESVLDTVTSGDLIPHDTMCVDTSSAFQKWYDFYEETQSNIESRDVNAKVLCPITSVVDGETFTQYVETNEGWPCALVQACTNAVELETPCSEECDDYCATFSGKPMKGVKQGTRDGLYEFAWNANNEDECNYMCRDRCEDICVGVCFNDRECISDCVFEDAFQETFMGKVRRGGRDGKMPDGEPDGKTGGGLFTPSRPGYPNLILDMLFGRQGALSHDYGDGVNFGKTAINRRAAQSNERPAFHVRSDELEYTMSLFMGSKCEQIQEMCVSKSRARRPLRYGYSD